LHIFAEQNPSARRFADLFFICDVIFPWAVLPVRAVVATPGSSVPRHRVAAIQGRSAYDNLKKTDCHPFQFRGR
jgi:hypothetical protein